MKKNILLAVLAFTITAAAQTGGTFDLSHSVVASGGGTSAAGQYSVSGTAGQSAAGTKSIGGTFGSIGGFWTPAAFPTAVDVSISGRLTTPDGSGISNVTISLTSPSGHVIAVRSGTFGYYSFTGVAAGQSYLLTINARHFTFPQSPAVISVNDELNGIDFVGQPN